MRLHLDTVSSFGLPSTDTDILEPVQWRATKNEGAEAHAQGKAEKIAQLEEEKAPGRSYSCLQVPNGGRQRRQPNPS